MGLTAQRQVQGEKRTEVQGEGTARSEKLEAVGEQGEDGSDQNEQEPAGDRGLGVDLYGAENAEEEEGEGR